MIKKRIVFLGVIIGLVLGGISILAGVFCQEKCGASIG
jgi:hypothetical protein